MSKIANIYWNQKHLINKQIEARLFPGNNLSSHETPISNSKGNIESMDDTACHPNYQQSFDNKLETPSNTKCDEDASDIHEQLMIDHKDSIDFESETV